MMEQAEARALVATRTWYHDWEIVPGVWTGGPCRVEDPAKTLDAYFDLPENLDGMRVLDIGAWDGVYSFELERRGAEVVSLDIQSPDACGYNTAHKILESKCRHIQADVCELGRDQEIGDILEVIPSCGKKPMKLVYLNEFDLVLYMGVYYHLKDPMRAWEAIKSVMKPDAKLCFEGLVLDYAWTRDPRLLHKQELIESIRDMPIAYFADKEFGYDESNWYVPTAQCVYKWLLAAGYKVDGMKMRPDMSRCMGTARLG